MIKSAYFYRPQRNCEGYVFTPVCHSVHSGGRSASVPAGIPPRKHTPLREAHPPLPRRRLALRTVRILLECILVWDFFTKLQETVQSWFSQTHKTGNIGIIANFVFPEICKFSSLFALHDASKCEIRHQWVQEDYI